MDDPKARLVVLVEAWSPLGLRSPEFVRSFEADASPAPSAPDAYPDSSLVWISVFIGASILALVFLTLGLLGIAMMLAAVAWFAASRGFHGTGNERKHGPDWP